MRRAIILCCLALTALVAAGWLMYGWLGEPAPRLPATVWVSKIDPVPAPAFSLMDQRGQRLSLASLSGKVVVLQFLDPACTDICPLISLEVVGASRRLGARAKGVVFAAINVNLAHGSREELVAYSHKYGLDQVPGWHFLSGAPAELEAAWRAYGVAVMAAPGGEVQHTAVVYFIDRHGDERYLGHPDRSKASMEDWAQTMAEVAGSLL